MNNLLCCQTVNVNCVAVNHVPFVDGQPLQTYCKTKYMKGVSCADQLYSAQPATNVHTGVLNLHIGARLNQFWKTWTALGVSPKVIRILKEGYPIPFQNRPTLTRSPIISSYVNPLKNSYPIEALHALIQNNKLET